MDIRELYWAAGFIEGEGSFGGTGVSGKGHQIQVGQKETEPLERLRRLFGGQIYMPHEDKKGRIPTWIATGVLARSIMMTLFPLCSRRRQHQIVMHLTPWRIKTDHGGKYCALRTHCSAGHEYTPGSFRVYKGVRHCLPCRVIISKNLAARRKEARHARMGVSLPTEGAKTIEPFQPLLFPL